MPLGANKRAKAGAVSVTEFRLEEDLVIDVISHFTKVGGDCFCVG